MLDLSKTIGMTTLSMMILGTNVGWTSPIIPMLKSPDSPFPVTSNEAAWITSFLMLGSLPGCILAALIVDRIGRKASLLVANIPLLVGWILILIAWHPYVLYVSRFISGIGMGSVYVLCPMYICEIADKNIRGALGSFIKLMMTIGELYGHAIGPYVSYAVLGYSCVIIPIIFFVSFVWMPESPYYLLMQDKRPDAEKSLRRLRRYSKDEELYEEINEMYKTVINDMSNRGHFWDLFSTTGNKKAVLICFGLQFILQFSGLAAIESYTQEIMEEAETELSAALAVIILGIFQLASGIGAAALADKAGRKPLLLSTTFLAGVTLTISGVFCYLKHHQELDMKPYGYLLVSSVIFYELIIALGLSPLAYMMLGELFSTNVKGIAVCLANLWSCLLAFVVSKLFQVVSDASGIDVSFAWFALTCFFGIAFIAIYVPETKGKSLAEIQDELNFGKKKPNHVEIIVP
ncbi:facilitated trehalose transporter Tret1-like isoform X2 [Belonocnema kinseyi]|uniref:facilitated trehalose transporter Tret1-like isoform X2 n=1 Tax=Belonocnema kinseyi TaxID=2817044 RepID=UPI00143E05E4|nr:facilitated trehalose transporter Tret1-like isoform X2 [Belonocnema kinseyi]